ncbi:TetR/AcrR family transcriptional regulator [Mycobacterium sp.]|uniref:TetR/AcrR family transcriptional regulator n=1 Tax=Mycobacterium sp. TaxID=1785 RepID=UPI002D972932|nr:TetR/AcrR family transcriptional regulator [Mycobacterium sp.]
MGTPPSRAPLSLQRHAAAMYGAHVELCGDVDVMATKSSPRPVPRRAAKRGQERADRTRALVIEETIRCIREEGFAAASTRHIIERAGVSWGVIQYHFGDRDGLLTAVIEYSFATLTESLNELADSAAHLSDLRERSEAVATAAWTLFFTPTSMTAMEILLATRALRGTLQTDELRGLESALTRIADLFGTDTPHAFGIANLLWAGPVGMTMAQAVMTDELPTQAEQNAMADLIADHLSYRRLSTAKKDRSAALRQPVKRSRAAKRGARRPEES